VYGMFFMCFWVVLSCSVFVQKNFKNLKNLKTLFKRPRFSSPGMGRNIALVVRCLGEVGAILNPPLEYFSLLFSLHISTETRPGLHIL